MTRCHILIGKPDSMALLRFLSFSTHFSSLYFLDRAASSSVLSLSSHGPVAQIPLRCLTGKPDNQRHFHSFSLYAVDRLAG